MTTNPTKQKVIDAASSLFFQKGFHGTSVRDIADKAAVNVSLISYYFKNKQGLLEYAVIHYYDSFIETMEQTIEKHKEDTDLNKCKILIHQILDFKMEYYQLTAFINRELSLDSTFVREVTVTYLAKENHVISTVFNKILHNKKHLQKTVLFMQLKGMLLSPFVLRHEWQSPLLDRQDRKNFVQQYIRPINEWIDFIAT